MPTVPGGSSAASDSRSNRGRDSADGDSRTRRRHRERSRDKKKRRSKSKSSKRRHRSTSSSSSSSNSSASCSSASSRSRSRKRKRKNKTEKKYRHRKRMSRSRDNSNDAKNDDSSVSSSVDYRERRRRNKKKRKKRRRRYSGSDNSDEGNGSRIRSVQHEDSNAKYHKSDHADDDTKPVSTAAPANINSTKQTAPPTIEVKKDTTKPGNAAAAAPKGPMTQSQYQELQSTIREVVDPHTGRTRWIRGTGEIIERIVSREEHSRLNANATLGDGSGYAKDVMRAAMRK